MCAHCARVPSSPSFLPLHQFCCQCTGHISSSLSVAVAVKPVAVRFHMAVTVNPAIAQLLLCMLQHGLNFFWMLGETFLNRIPFYPYLLGYVGIWTSAYGVWAFANFSSTGKWMYPFLDADQPWAPFAYFGLFLVHWVFFGFVILLLQLKYWLWKQVPSSKQEVEVQMAKRR